MREFGPVRFLLGQSPAEIEAAKPYMGIARTQLGITKNLMNLGGLQQLGRAVTLQDGTVIRCQSVMGQDFIAITPPTRVPAPAPLLRPETPLETKPRKKRLHPIYGPYAWTRLADGPAKYGHHAVWDHWNERLLVWSGFDRISLPTVPAQAGYAATYSLHPGGQRVSQEFDYSGVGYPSLGWSSADYTAQGIVYSAYLSYPDTGTGRTDAIAADGNGTGWGEFGIVFFGTPYVDYYGNVFNSSSLYQYRKTGGGGELLAVYTSYVPDTPIWITYGRGALTGGEARFFTSFPVTYSTITGMASSDGGYWYNSGGTTIGWTEDYTTAKFYFDEGANAWMDHADAYLRTANVINYPGSHYYPAHPSTEFDLLMSSALWQFTEAGGWTQLADISFNAWNAIVAYIEANPIAPDNFPWGADRSLVNAWGLVDSGAPDGDSIVGVTYTGYDIDNGTDDWDYVEYYFGGSIDGSDTNASVQLWRYSRSVTYVEIDDPT